MLYAVEDGPMERSTSEDEDFDALAIYRKAKQKSENEVDGV